MNEIEENEIQTLEVNHLGLIAGICKKLKISERYEIKDGNSSDKNTFRESTIEIANKKKQLKDSLNQIYLSDSALYTSDNIKAMKNMSR